MVSDSNEPGHTNLYMKTGVYTRRRELHRVEPQGGSLAYRAGSSCPKEMG